MAHRCCSGASVLSHSPPPIQTRRTEPVAHRVLVLIGHLLGNSALPKLFAGVDPKAAVLHGSLLGLASGVEAVIDENNAVKSEAREHPLRSALTISAYVVGGIAMALIYRGIRRNTQASST